MASIPKPQTLTINVGDIMNYQGKNYTITAVGAGVDDGKGTISYAVTVNGVVVTVSANDTVLMNPGTEASSTGVQVWAHGVGDNQI